MKILHIVGGSPNNGVFKGANILHKSLLQENIHSIILNDTIVDKNGLNNFNSENLVFFNDSIFKKIFNKLFVNFEKVLKFIFLHSPRETFTIGLMGSDITKIKEYKDADIIHIHWLSQGFIKMKSLSKVKKPIVWTMRDMWSFTGGAHYTMDFLNYENSKISDYFKNYKKKIFKQNFHFVAVSNWLKEKAKDSDVLGDHEIIKIDNNISVKDFNKIDKSKAHSLLNISTKKKIILYGAQNPQSKRKGWDIFLSTLEKLDKSRYYLLIFGNFWSHNVLNKTGIEYKSLGFINDNKTLSAIYSAADLFVASSIQDAWPKTFAEAMSCELPVVCFDNTSISEIVDHKSNGFVVKNRNSDELKFGIDWLSERIEDNLDYGKKGRKKIENFDSKVIAKKYISLYEKLLNNR